MKNKFTSHKQYFFCLFFSGSPKKAHTDQSIQKAFLLCLEGNDSQTFKSIATAEKHFFGVYVIGTTYFNKLFLFHVTTERQCFLQKFIVTLRLFSTAMFVCCLKQVIWNKSVFYFVSQQYQYQSTVQIPRLQNETLTYHQNETLIYHAKDIAECLRSFLLNFLNYFYFLMHHIFLYKLL